MLIYAIRHGETDWNREGRLQGQRDIPLNETGRAQARENGKRLARLLGPRAAHFDYVASPLSRTRETMEILRAAMGLEPDRYRLDGRMVELSFGDWEGLTLGELEDRDPERLRAREANKWDFLPPGSAAESYEILSWRIAAWRKSLSSETVCVGHGGMIRSLHYLFAGWSGERAANAPTPQDRILKLGDGVFEWV